MPPTVITVRCTAPSGSEPSGASPSGSRSTSTGASSSRSDIAALDAQSAIGIDADEDAGAGDLGGIVDHRASIEGLQRRLDLAEPLIDLVGELLGLGVFRLQPVILGAQRVVAGLLLVR